LLKAGVFSAKWIQKLAAGFVELNWYKIMLNSILLSAALLLSGQSMSSSKMIVEPQVIEAPIMFNAAMMTSATETLLIEGYAAPHWGMSANEAWYQYRVLKAIKITEIVPEQQYIITMGAGILQVLILDDGN
jgi:hypothetical protein